jgi:hypothetical protein
MEIKQDKKKSIIEFDFVKSKIPKFKSIQENRVATVKYEFNNINTDPTIIIQEKLRKGKVDYTELPDLKDIFTDTYNNEFTSKSKKIKISKAPTKNKKFNLDEILTNKEEMLLVDPDDSQDKILQDQEQVKKLQNWENKYLMPMNSTNYKMNFKEIESLKIINKLKNSLNKDINNDKSKSDTINSNKKYFQNEHEINIILMMNINISRKKFDFNVFEDTYLNSMLEILNDENNNCINKTKENDDYYSKDFNPLIFNRRNNDLQNKRITNSSYKENKNIINSLDENRKINKYESGKSISNEKSNINNAKPKKTKMFNLFKNKGKKITEINNLFGISVKNIIDGINNEKTIESNMYNNNSNVLSTSSNNFYTNFKLPNYVNTEKSIEEKISKIKEKYSDNTDTNTQNVKSNYLNYYLNGNHKFLNKSKLNEGLKMIKDLWSNNGTDLSIIGKPALESINNQCIKSFYNTKNYLNDNEMHKTIKTELDEEILNKRKKSLGYVDILVSFNKMSKMDEKTIKNNKFIINNDMLQYSDIEKYRVIIKNRMKVELFNRKE